MAASETVGVKVALVAPGEAKPREVGICAGRVVFADELRVGHVPDGAYLRLYGSVTAVDLAADKAYVDDAVTLATPLLDADSALIPGRQVAALGCWQDGVLVARLVVSAADLDLALVRRARDARDAVFPQPWQ
ncbi:uncharacterized protein AMSG_02211 [Thecamonas trahens ATCC 50062]|uniref:Uncharacterized protein n=1 Tax=Thecamonas trahens ATCC 50062 TaxID=461836 RepID=A0A0L0DVY7_THETB|nr:hypothetical protein AMSG_02211 [Thecamonas trahens ATCC 50062]KNC56241.1 hypothetical protein AMSG_02211 [Thecamonas trahens ATCC 50062]|eukprot:XP_013760763.1 hypothetical protein AMSG_02211 [Thecamonas trahens ATCC 50062]